MRIQSPAKINLFLGVGSRQKGFHKLASLVDPVDLYDDICIEPSHETEVRFSSSWPIPEVNTVSRSIKLLEDFCGRKFHISVRVEKKIPPGSGMGGGSSDAASVLEAVNRLCNLGLSPGRLAGLGALIGKDVPLFMCKERCVIRGFGEKVSAVGFSKKLYYVIYVPGYSVSTADVYRVCDDMENSMNLTAAGKKIKILKQAIEGGDMHGIEEEMFNSLEKPYLRLYPAAKEVKSYLENTTGKRVFVSGSGGTLFSVFLSREKAEKQLAVSRIKGWHSYVLATVTSCKRRKNGNY